MIHQKFNTIIEQNTHAYEGNQISNLLETSTTDQPLLITSSLPYYVYPKKGKTKTWSVYRESSFYNSAELQSVLPSHGDTANID